MPLMIWALLAGPVFGLVAVGYVRLIGWISHHHVSGRTALAAPAVAFGVPGLIAFAYPQLLGNGKDMAHDAFLGRFGLVALLGRFGLVALLALFALKPLATALCLGSGATGGLFTPTLSAAAMLGAAMQAPLAGLALVLELTHSGFRLMIPMIAATVIATVLARYIDGYSIYSARLRAT